MNKRTKRFILGVFFVALALGATASVSDFSAHPAGVNAPGVAFADDGCDSSHPPPWLDCPEATPTATATPTPSPGG